MDSTFTIVLPDTDLVTRVCGTNDSNLKLIETHLGVPVFTRGNELSLDNDDPQIRQQFQFIIDRIVDEIAESGESSPDMVEAILNGGHEHTSFNAAEYAIAVPGAVRKVYPKTKNQARLVQAFRSCELVFATGPAGSGKTFLAVAEALRLVLTLGAEGCRYAAEGVRLAVPAMKVRTIDTTGAGDTFTGYFLAAVARGEMPEAALKLATAASALAVTRPGAADSVPSLREVQAFLQKENMK